MIAGILISIMSLAKLMTYLLSHLPIPTWAFFFGLIVASSVFILRDIKDWKLRDCVMLVLGVILGVVVCTLSPTETPDALWFIFLSGAIAICAMILPGISGSFILLILGKYEFMLSTLTKILSGDGVLLDFAVVVIFVLGALVGILAFSRFLHWLLARYHRSTLLVRHKTNNMRRKYTLEEKLRVIELYRSGLGNRLISRETGCERSAVKWWIRQFRTHGEPYFMERSGPPSYDSPFKESVVREVLEKGISLHSAATKFGINRELARGWIRLVKEGGYESLMKKRKKKDSGEELPEVERLRTELERANTQIALLKKVKALVEERERRLLELGQKPSSH